MSTALVVVVKILPFPLQQNMLTGNWLKQLGKVDCCGLVKLLNLASLSTRLLNEVLMSLIQCILVNFY